MFKPILILIVCITIQTCVLARLGETKDQLTARFGTATDHYKDTIIVDGHSYIFCTLYEFQTDNCKILCAITDNRCSRISYTRDNWTNEDLETVINANAQGGKWRRLKNRNLPTWQRDDSATAVFEPTSGNITITNPAYARYREAAIAIIRADAPKQETPTTLPKI